MVAVLRAILPYPTGPGDVRKWLFNNVSPNLFRSLSGNAFLDLLKGQGLGIRRTDFFEIRREILGYERFEEQIKALKPETRVPRAWFNTANEFELNKDFQYRFTVTGTDPITGESKEQIFSWLSDVEVNVEVAERSIADLLRDEEEFYELSIDRAQLIQAWNAGGVFDR